MAVFVTTTVAIVDGTGVGLGVVGSAAELDMMGLDVGVCAIVGGSAGGSAADVGSASTAGRDAAGGGSAATAVVAGGGGGGGSDCESSPAGVTSICVCPWQTHCSQSVAAWPGQVTGSNLTTALSPKTSACAMMSKW